MDFKLIINTYRRRATSASTSFLRTWTFFIQLLLLTR